MSEWGSKKVLVVGIQRNPSFKVVMVEDQWDALLRCWDFYRLSTYKEAAPVVKGRKREVSSFHFPDFSFEGYSSGGMIHGPHHRKVVAAVDLAGWCHHQWWWLGVKGQEEGACGASAAQPALVCAQCQSWFAPGAIPTTRAGFRH